jgi:hypothetical protein
MTTEKYIVYDKDNYNPLIVSFKELRVMDFLDDLSSSIYSRRQDLKSKKDPTLRHKIKDLENKLSLISEISCKIELIQTGIRI